MDFEGIIIQESLDNREVLGHVNILKTKVEPVNEKHATPWVKQWTLHTIRIPEASAEYIARKIARDMDLEHHWYADFKNDLFHYIVFLKRVFKVDRKRNDYKEAISYGASLGIPLYQLDFAPIRKSK